MKYITMGKRVIKLQYIINNYLYKIQVIPEADFRVIFDMSYLIIEYYLNTPCKVKGYTILTSLYLLQIKL